MSEVPLIGAIVERPTSKPKPIHSQASSSTGFPTVEHRSKAKSAFARSRENRHSRVNGEETSVESRGLREAPIVASSSSLKATPVTAPVSPPPTMSLLDPGPSEFSGRTDDWRESMRRQNDLLVAQMSDGERKRHAEEIVDQLGPNVQDLLRRLKARRTQERGFNEVEGMVSQEEENVAGQIFERTDPDPGEGEGEKGEASQASEKVEFSSEPSPPRLRPITRPTSPLRGILISSTPSSPSTRPGTPTKASRRGKLRFKEVGEEDVRVFQSEPSTPRRVLGLLPAPDPSNAAESSSFSKESPSKTITERETKKSDVEEGTPEDIRRRFFPHLPAHDPALEWIEGPSSISHHSSSTSSALSEATLNDSSDSIRDDSDLRFDLTGTPISPSLQSSLPTHLGLHHHEEGDKAGYTLSELYMLARSSVTAQRSLGLSVLSRIVRRIAKVSTHHSSPPALSTLNDGKRSHGLVEMQYRQRTMMRQRALVLGLFALDDKGSGGSGRNTGVLIQAIDLVFACIVLWDQTCVEGLHCIELKPTSSSMTTTNTDPLHATNEPGEDMPMRTESDDNLDADPLASLPYHALLPQLASFFPNTHSSTSSFTSIAIAHTESILPQLSLIQLLATLCRLARHSASIAEAITKEDGLVEGLLRWGLVEPATAFYLLPDKITQKDDLGQTHDIEIRMVPEVLQLIRVLAESSRANALALQSRGVSDALLRFVTSGLPSSIFPTGPNAGENRSLSTEITKLRKVTMDVITGTLEFYASLARFGLYSSVATTASEHFSSLFASCSSLSSDRGSRDEKELHSIARLQVACLRVLEAWIICATDPHKTSPPHELLWTQVDGWAWGDELLTFRASVIEAFRTSDDSSDAEIKSDGDMHMSVVTAGWDALGAWLEGCRTNRPKAGAEEKELIGGLIQKLCLSNSDDIRGLEEKVLRAAVGSMQSMLPLEEKDANTLQRLAEVCGGLSAFSRLTVSCIPRTSEIVDQSIGLKPWILKAHSLLSPVAFSLLVSDDLGRDIASNTSDPLYKYRMTFARYASAFIAHFSSLHCAVVALSNLGSGRNDSDLFGLASLSKLAPGYEGQTLNIITSFIYTLDGASQRKASLLIPFFSHILHPAPIDDSLEPSDSYAHKTPFAIAPVNPSPLSLASSTTQILPADCTPLSSSRPLSSLVGLPLRDDWATIALDHLLRSGTSVVFTNPNAIPEGWAASEVDLAQASLGLMLALQRRFGSLPIQAIEENEPENKIVSESRMLRTFAPTMEECAFACMKIFMLEHNSPTTRNVRGEADTSGDVDPSQEVFRDPGIGQLMEDLLRPFTAASMSTPSSVRTEWDALKKEGRSDLSSVSRSFLGSGTPFFQFYTDFVTLYDAISFSHPTFARLLLVPLSYRYEKDYRNLLWGDYGHVLRTVKTTVGDMLISREGEAALESYFYPPEDDLEMIGYYLRALVSGPMEGFVRLLAIHHVACMIWPDLHRYGTGSAQTAECKSRTESLEMRAKSLLLAVFKQANPGVVREVVRYSQPSWPFVECQRMRPPPACFEGMEECIRGERIAFLRGETRLEDAVANLLRS